MLKLDNVSSSYGESKVIKNVSLEISSGKFFAILGKNGMGKTTLLKTIMGLMDKSEGEISLDETNLSKVPTNLRAKFGLGYVPQGRVSCLNLLFKKI